ncbi:MAG TPA: 6-bladed beta-propeller [Longimicrobiales bacterium]|nr:6-bladed beta-propeller [Longimicrobiales bacterium]
MTTTHVWCLIAGLASALTAGREVEAQDTLIVRAEQPALWGAAPTLVEELRIGSLDGSQYETFGRLTAAAVGPAGEMLVVDGQGPALRLYDSTGRYRLQLGRPGQGPGEYRQIMGVRFTREGRVAIWDPGNQRITVYETDGGLFNSIRVESSLQGGNDPFQVDTAGNFYVRAMRSHEGAVITGYTWIKIGPGGGVLDSIPVPPADTEGRPLVVLTPSGPRKPFTIETTSALSPFGYQVTGRTDTYAIWRPLSDGRVLRIERPVRSVPVGREERQQWEAILDFMQSVSRAGSAAFLPIPAEKPVFRELWVDESGRIWVSRYVPANHVALSREELEEREGRPALEWIEPPVWDVWDPRGSFLGTLTLQRGAFPAAARGSEVWVVEHGSFGESYFVRYRVNAGG